MTVKVKLSPFIRLLIRALLFHVLQALKNSYCKDALVLRGFYWWEKMNLTIHMPAIHNFTELQILMMFSRTCIHFTEFQAGIILPEVFCLLTWKTWKDVVLSFSLLRWVTCDTWSNTHVDGIHHQIHSNNSKTSIYSFQYTVKHSTDSVNKFKCHQ